MCFSGVKLTTETVTARSSLEKSNLLTKTAMLSVYDNVRFTGGIIDEAKFFEWIAAGVALKPGTSPTGKDALRNITVTALNEKGQAGFKWILYNAQPVGYELSPFDSMKNALITESLEFTIQGVERES